MFNSVPDPELRGVGMGVPPLRRFMLQIPRVIWCTSPGRRTPTNSRGMVKDGSQGTCSSPAPFAANPGWARNKSSTRRTKLWQKSASDAGDGNGPTDGGWIRHCFEAEKRISCLLDNALTALGASGLATTAGVQPANGGGWGTTTPPPPFEQSPQECATASPHLQGGRISLNQISVRGECSTVHDGGLHPAPCLPYTVGTAMHRARRFKLPPAGRGGSATKR